MKQKENKKKNLTILGSKVTKFTHLETFPRPKGVEKVTCMTDEVTAVCPITGQPDWYKVEITYQPYLLCVESKALKLFLQSFRNAGHFCENFSSIIMEKLKAVLAPHSIEVTVIQKPRGGISIISTASYTSL